LPEFNKTIDISIFIILIYSISNNLILLNSTILYTLLNFDKNTPHPLISRTKTFLQTVSLRILQNVKYQNMQISDYCSFAFIFSNFIKSCENILKISTKDIKTIFIENHKSIF